MSQIIKNIASVVINAKCKRFESDYFIAMTNIKLRTHISHNIYTYNEKNFLS